MRERGSEEEDGEGEREAVRKRMERKGEVVRRTTTLINFPRQCLQWFLKID